MGCCLAATCSWYIHVVQNFTGPQAFSCQHFIHTYPYKYYCISLTIINIVSNINNQVIKCNDDLRVTLSFLTKKMKEKLNAADWTLYKVGSSHSSNVQASG